MNTNHAVRLSSPRRLVVILVLTLLLLLVVTQFSVAAGTGFPAAGGKSSGIARWQSLGLTPTGPTPQFADSRDWYVASFDGSGTVGPNCFDLNDVVRYRKSDALFYDANAGCWVPWFSGVRSGLTAQHDISALDDECGPDNPGCSILLSFRKNLRVPGVGRVAPQDVVIADWVGGTLDTYENFSPIFDGSDAGLTTAGEAIDGLFAFPPGTVPDSMDCLYILLISTKGAYTVHDGNGDPITGGGEQVLSFCGATFGEDTSGVWSLYHDGSAEGLGPDQLIALSHEGFGGRGFFRFDFLTQDAMDVDTARGGPSQVFHFQAPDGEYVGPTFSFPNQAGTTDLVDSLHVYYDPQS